MVRFGAKSLIPTLIIIAVLKEGGPIITSLVISGRVGAGIGAELGSMKVTEQVDAIEASTLLPPGMTGNLSDGSERSRLFAVSVISARAEANLKLF